MSQIFLEHRWPLQLISTEWLPARPGCTKNWHQLKYVFVYRIWTIWNIFIAQYKKLEKIKDKHLHSIQCCVHGYSREMVHKLANYWCPNKHWKLDIIYSIRLLIQNISLKFSTVARTFVKKPTIATGNRLGWRIASAAGQAKFHSCSTKLPNK